VRLFLLIAFGGSWGLAGVAYAAGVRLTPFTAVLIGVPYMFFPALAAWVVERRRGARVRQSLDIRFRPNWWWLAAWWGPLMLAFTTLGIGLLLPGVSFTHDPADLLTRYAGVIPPEKIEAARASLANVPFSVFLGSSVLQALVAGITVNAVGAFGEELGWRGYLQREFSPFGFWKGSVLVGLFWGPWHAALILQGYNYPQHPVVGVVVMTVMTMLLSPLIAAVRIHGRSVVAASVAHGSFNAAAGFPLLLSKGGDDLLVGATGLAGLIALALANGVLFLVLRRVPGKP
jgi:membrane protease YdiL (CAAX protease family)